MSSPFSLSAPKGFIHTERWGNVNANDNGNNSNF